MKLCLLPEPSKLPPTHGIGRVLHAQHQYLPAHGFEFVQGDSAEVGRAFTLPVDYLFIDGDHHAPGVRADCEAWLPHMRSNGFVLFHDYWPYPADHALAGVDYWPDVREVANEQMNGAKVVLDSDRLRVYQIT